MRKNKQIPRHSRASGNPVNKRNGLLKQKFEPLRDKYLLDAYFRGHDELTLVGQQYV